LSKKIPNIEWEIDKARQPHETKLLLLDSSKAKIKLGWSQKLSLELALDKTIEWYQAMKNNQLMADFSISQIKSFISNQF